VEASVAVVEAWNAGEHICIAVSPTYLFTFNEASTLKDVCNFVRQSH
jgi:hypothetical protein